MVSSTCLANSPSYKAQAAALKAINFIQSIDAVTKTQEHIYRFVTRALLTQLGKLGGLETLLSQFAARKALASGVKPPIYFKYEQRHPRKISGQDYA